MSRSKARRHRAPAPTPPDPLAHIITPERWQHDEFIHDTPEVKATESRTTLRVTTQTPLDRYHVRGVLDGRTGVAEKDRVLGNRRYLAGDRLRTTWHRAGIAQRVTGSYEEPSGGGRDWADLSASALAARTEYREAMQAVGIILSPVAVAVCCLDETAGAWALQHGRGDHKQGVALLLAALDTLVHHWRL